MTSTPKPLILTNKGRKYVWVFAIAGGLLISVGIAFLSGLSGTPAYHHHTNPLLQAVYGFVMLGLGAAMMWIADRIIGKDKPTTDDTKY
jgi:hypothetical protein